MWDYDLFEPEGEAKFKQLVGEIKEMVAALRDVRKPYYLPIALVLTSWSHNFVVPTASEGSGRREEQSVVLHFLSKGIKNLGAEEKG